MENKYTIERINTNIAHGKRLMKLIDSWWNWWDERKRQADHYQEWKRGAQTPTDLINIKKIIMRYYKQFYENLKIVDQKLIFFKESPIYQTDKRFF